MCYFITLKYTLLSLKVVVKEYKKSHTSYQKKKKNI